jgi:hypothetical protein
VAALTQQLRARDQARVQTFQAYVQDIPKEKLADARYVGDLRPNQNRLNGFALSASGDSEDYFRFNLNYAGTVHLGMLVDSLDKQRNVVQSETAQGLGIQVIQYQGNSHSVIADSNPSAGAAYTMYQQLSGADGSPLTRGKYVVRVYKEDGTPDTQEFFYSFQLSGDRFSQDYDTIQQEAPAHPVPQSILNYLTINPVIGLLAASMDPTMSAQATAASQPATLQVGASDGTDPVTKLLNTFM